MKQTLCIILEIILTALLIATLLWIFRAERVAIIYPLKVYAQTTKNQVSGAIKSTADPFKGYPIDYKAFIASRARAYGVNPNTATWIVQHESNFNPSAVGDHGESYGLWQIHLRNHLDISKSAALDPEKSTKWAMEEIVAGRVNQWSSWRWRDYWYN